MAVRRLIPPMYTPWQRNTSRLLSPSRTRRKTRRCGFERWRAALARVSPWATTRGPEQMPDRSPTVSSSSHYTRMLRTGRTTSWRPAAERASGRKAASVPRSTKTRATTPIPARPSSTEAPITSVRMASRDLWSRTNIHRRAPTWRFSPGRRHAWSRPRPSSC